MKTKQNDLARERVSAWAGMYVVLIGREYGHADKVLMDSMTEAESRELCAAAATIIARRAA
jgi:hypothetical protein